MNTVSEKISEIITSSKPKLVEISPKSARRKASPDSWSMQEILGHLIDSALNNHQRVVGAR